MTDCLVPKGGKCSEKNVRKERLLHPKLSKKFSYENAFILINVPFPNTQKNFCRTAAIYQMSTKDYITLKF